MEQPPVEWSLEHRFTPIRDKYNRSLYDRQRILSTEIKCAIQLGDTVLQSNEDGTYLFTMNVSPLEHKFKLELSLASSLENRMAQQTTNPIRYRISAQFSAHGTYPASAAPREPTTYEGKDTTPSALLHTFSEQLQNVSCRTRDLHNDPNLFTSPDKPPSNMIVVAWVSSSCQKFDFDRDISMLNDTGKDMAIKFRMLVNEFVSSGKRLYVHTTKIKSMWEAWARFTSLPFPAPLPYWPWLRQKNDMHPIKMLALDGPYRIEADPEWIEKALTPYSRVVKNSLAPLEVVRKFANPREYLAVVLGAFSYEEAFSKGQRKCHLDRFHVCDVLPSSWDKNQLLILLNVRPTITPGESVDQEANTLSRQELVDIGEQARIEIVMQEITGRETWFGKVVEVPSLLRKTGFNVAVLAVRPPQPRDPNPAPRRLEAYFEFGQSGGSSRGLRETVLDFMVGANCQNPKLKDFIFARDNNEINLQCEPETTRQTWRRDVMDKYITPRQFNTEQTSAVMNHLTHRVTLLAGPPGTGKTTVIDALVQIEVEYFKLRVWVVAESNAAVDVLAAEFVKRTGLSQASQVYRIYPAYKETFEEEDKSGGCSGLSNLPSYKSIMSNVSQADIDKMMKTSGGIRKDLSLGVDIMRRYKMMLSDKLVNLYYPSELDDLKLYHAARLNMQSPRYEPDATNKERIAFEQSLRRKEMLALRTVQKNYIRHAKCIFSTASAASNDLMVRIRPNIVIIDEASQMIEARSAHILTFAASRASIHRMLLVGDHLQLPPTVIADRNPFKKNAEVSQFERLIDAGTKHVLLKEQFRSHPQISATWNKLIYGGQLRDAVSTRRLAQSIKFTNFVRQKLHPTFPTGEPCCSVFLSMVKSSAFHWGSELRPGSTSRLNFQTAATIMIVVDELCKNGYKMEDILITCFYTDQVHLLQALFSHASFSKLKIKTVDEAQGCEARIHIVDCVVLGGRRGGAGDTLGFLAREKRRYNVAMSRAQEGRIVIGHERMTAGYSNTIWDYFLDDESRLGHVVDFPIVWSDDQMHEFFNSVRDTYNIPGPSAPGRSTLTNSVALREQQLLDQTKPLPERSQGLITALVEETGLDDNAAMARLVECKLNLETAVETTPLDWAYWYDMVL